MTGPRLRRLLALIVLGAVVRRVVRALRGDATRVFDQAVHRPAAPAPPAPDQQARPEAVPAATPPDELPFAPAAATAPPPAVEAVRTEAASPGPTTSTTTASREQPAASPTWAAPVDGACPEGYPVKAKLRSGIFHLPGMSAYDRTAPDRCYPDADSATADGLRAAKR